MKKGYKDININQDKEDQLEEIKEELPSLGSEESEMYCTCRDRMKRNRTSWSVTGAESLLKVIMNKMNGTIREIITKKAEKKIKEELAERIPEPKKVAKKKYEEMRYVGTGRILENVGQEKIKEDIKNILRNKKMSEMLQIM